MVQVLSAVVEAELALLEVEEEHLRMHASESRRAALGIAPGPLDAVGVLALWLIPLLLGLAGFR